MTIETAEKRAALSFFDRPLLRGIQQGFMLMTPAILIGAFVVALINIPIPPLQYFLQETFGDAWQTLPTIIFNGTMQIISLIAVICISYSIALTDAAVAGGRMHIVFPIMTALICYVIFQRPEEITGAVITAKAASSTSMFTAMLIAITSVKFLILFAKVFGKHVKERKYFFGGAEAFRAAFHILLPMLATIGIYAAANLLIHYTGFDEMTAGFAMDVYRTLFLGDNIGKVFLVVFIVHILWFFGIHGNNVFLEAYDAAQADVVAQGMENPEFTKVFFDVFVFIGGAGSTLALVVVLILFGRKYAGHKLGKVALIPGLLNVNEPIIYGLPIVLNVYMFVPFLAAPIASAFIAYGAVKTGIMPLPVYEVEWTTPLLISGYEATGSVSAIFVQLTCFSVSFFIYLPFVRFLAKKNREREKMVYAAMAKEVRYLITKQPNRIMSRSDDMGALARRLGRELGDRLAYDADANALHMEFQPKSAADGRAYGVEALLRWTHKDFGDIPPEVVIALAEEAGENNKLGNWVIRQSLKAKRRFKDAGYEKLRMSINLTPTQLNTDTELYETIMEYMSETEVDPRTTEFELTENATIDVSDTLLKTFAKLRIAGASFSIDDFGMGHSSLKYLFDFFANVVKLDTSLVQSVTKGEDQRLVVASILDLCKKLDVLLICEGIETKEQLDIMSELGAERFQGWYFSKALKEDELLAYLERRGTTWGENAEMDEAEAGR
ncbi:MAG: EAL domain-containing protein [Clostridiales Family XIII bacterium]|jgi:lactose/cellobiose-specific phosphotransferase system IIC component|nr:EAL domain-containing protein [Clostridiales Family XIII bacterium]